VSLVSKSIGDSASYKVYTNAHFLEHSVRTQSQTASFVTMNIK